MPFDLAILRRLDKAHAGEANVRGTGNTSYIWEAYENDVQLDSLNQLVTIEGTDKLAQEIMKILLTPKGGLTDDPDYGTSLMSLVGEKFSTDRFAEVQTEVVNALIHYNQLNADNPNSDEVIEVIQDIGTVRDSDDPRHMQVYVRVITESGKTVAIVAPQVL